MMETKRPIGCTRLLALGTLGLSVCIMLAGTIQGTQTAQEEAENPVQEGVEPLTRGPIHEAFAMPSSPNPVPSPVIAKKPPDPIEEIPSDQKPAGDNVVWIPGYFAWDDERADFLWISGFWRDAPPERQWIPGNWTEAEGGSQWISGYWAPAEQEVFDYLPPPPASLDNGPSIPAPTEDSVYSPGCWIYRQTRFF